MKNISSVSFVKVLILAFAFLASLTGLQAAEREPVQLFVHGGAEYAQRTASGRLQGSLVDAFSCAMTTLQIPFVIDTAPMLRVGDLIKERRLDIWYPLFDDGRKGKEEQFIHYGDDTVIYWHIWPSRPDEPTDDSFRKEARVTAFPTSAPSRYLKKGGYNYVVSTDDENALMLWFLNGRLDAVLAPDIRGGLKPGARRIAEQFRLVEYARYRSGFSVTTEYQKKYPTFKGRFASALKKCTPAKSPAE